jgi:hypothetical protein
VNVSLQELVERSKHIDRLNANITAKDSEISDLQQQVAVHSYLPRPVSRAAVASHAQGVVRNVHAQRGVERGVSGPRMSCTSRSRLNPTRYDKLFSMFTSSQGGGAAAASSARRPKSAGGSGGEAKLSSEQVKLLVDTNEHHVGFYRSRLQVTCCA